MNLWFFVYCSQIELLLNSREPFSLRDKLVISNHQEEIKSSSSSLSSTEDSGLDLNLIIRVNPNDTSVRAALRKKLILGYSFSVAGHNKY